MTVRGIPIIYYGDEQYLADYHLFELNGYSYNKATINSTADDPFNRPGMKSWDEDTSAFKIIHTLAALRRTSTAISEGAYLTLYVDSDTLVFERVKDDHWVIVAVNRGGAKNLSVDPSGSLAPGLYHGLLAGTSQANAGSYARVTPGGTTLHLGPLSSLVLSSQ
jgi:cyclomaltodextrin glucanotransferase